MKSFSYSFNVFLHMSSALGQQSTSLLFHMSKISVMWYIVIRYDNLFRRLPNYWYLKIDSVTIISFSYWLIQL